MARTTVALDGRPQGFALSTFIIRQASLAGGIAIFASLALGVAAMSTWNVTDPSLSFATGKPATNILGYPGAVFADIIMQLYGLASVFALLPPLALSIALMLHRRINRFAQRFAAWFGGSILAAAAVGCIPPPITWPLPNGAGGVAGDLVLRLPALFAGAYPSGTFGLILGCLIAVPAAWLLMIACGLLLRNPPERAPKAASNARTVAQGQADARDDGDEDEGYSLIAVFFGGAAHHWYNLQARFRRIFGIHGSNRGGSQIEEPYDFNEDEYASLDPAAAEIDEAPYSASHEERPAHAAPAVQRRIIAAPPADPYFDEDDDAPFDIDVPQSRPAAVSPRVSMPPQPQRAAVPQHQPAAEAPRPAPMRTTLRAPAPTPRGHDGFTLPSTELLAEPKSTGRDATLSPEALEHNARLLEGVLDDFGVKGEIIHVRPGPVVTLYELEPAPGIKSSRVIGLADDIARSMSAIAARVAVVQGRNAIGIELPNQKREMVYLRELIENQEFHDAKGKLALTLGKTIGGEPVIADLAKMPHLLVAGTTGSGKSVAINTMILSLLYRLSPEKCRLIMIDPKMLELSVYDGIPHLLSPVVTDPKKAVVALKWTVREMEDRYKKMSKIGVRNIDGFNTRVEQALQSGEAITRTVQTGFDRETGEAVYETEEFALKPLPYIVVIIDEMADLMMVAGKDIEGAVQRLAQMARAAGIHVIMATQRPSVDVITGTIKANFPTRISFQVTSKIDSRTILGEQGAEQLLGQGDMLYMAGGGRIQRVHGPFVSDHEVEDIVAYLKTQGVPQYLDAITEDDEDGDGEGGGGPAGTSNLADSDDPYDQAVAVVLRDGKASTSYIQRRLGIGYNRAASIIERMEQEGIVGPANHAGKREILVPTESDITGGV
ncbi:MAG TPA: DNA translocase FtsK [Ensifer sp.]|nr:DNA translocase FtsK [Ensifer sp.]